MDIKTILVPTDLSPPSQQALQAASVLARRHQSRLVIVHVMDLPVVYCENPLVYRFPAEEENAAKQELAGLIPPDASIPFEHRLLKGDTAVAILQAAEESSADLIVIGTHGHTGGMHAILGSVAEKVLQNARCPVMMVKVPHTAHPPDQTLQSADAASRPL